MFFMYDLNNCCKSFAIMPVDYLCLKSNVKSVNLF